MIVHTFRPASDLGPGIHAFQPFMRLYRVVFARADDVDGVTESGDHICFAWNALSAAENQRHYSFVLTVGIWSSEFYHILWQDLWHAPYFCAHNEQAR